MTDGIITHETFEATSWHDNFVHGMSIVIGDIANSDWRSNLIFDIDYISEWVCNTEGQCRFRVAPATLTFHDVTDLNVALLWPGSGFQNAVCEPALDHIEREPVSDQKICLDRPYYHWRMIFNLPTAGQVSFGASGYAQVLRSQPVLQDQQSLLSMNRTPFVSGE